MTDAHLPATGSVKVVKPQKAAKLVEQVARDTENPDVATERLLIVLDIDGTVLLEDESLSPGVVEAVEHAHRAGHEVMLATGRSWEGTRGILHVLQIAPEFVVCSNGAVIMRRIDGDEARYERFHIETFDATEVLTLLREHLPDAHYMVELADGRRLYTDFLEDWNLTQRQAGPLRRSRRTSPSAASSWCRPARPSTTSSIWSRASGSTRSRTRSAGPPGSTSPRWASTRAPRSSACATGSAATPRTSS